MFSNQEVWRERFLALKSMIVTTQDNFLTQKKIRESSQEIKLSPFQERSIDSLLSLLQFLEKFAENQFFYFYNGFSNNSLNPSNAFPIEYVFETILYQISSDVKVISQILSQHFSACQETIKTLAIATQLGQYAIEPIADAYNLSGTLVLPYLQKSTSIRVVPYAKVVLLGIPYTTISVTRDFLAIPHEVGHFLFWQGTREIEESNGSVTKKSIAQILNGFIKTVEDQDTGEREFRFHEWRWLEEIFADVYGCFLAGPAIALSFQDLQMRSSVEDFVKDDEEHPVPILRPRIYAKVLKEKYSEDWALTLDEEWRKKWPRITMNEKAQYKQRNGHTKLINLSISDGLDIGDKAVDDMIRVTLDLNLLKPNFSSQTSFWAALLPDKVNVDSLYKILDEKLKNEFGELAELLKVKQDDTENIERSFTELIAHWEEEGKLIQSKNPAYEPWISILNAGGWTTKGPDCEATGGVCTG